LNQSKPLDLWALWPTDLRFL